VSPTDGLPGWNALQEAIAVARSELAAAAVDAESAVDADAYLLRVVTANLADGFLSHLLASDGLMRVLPTKGGSNPDYLMSHTVVDATRRYRLEGNLQDSERVGIGLYSFAANGAALLAGYAAFSRQNVSADGAFSLELSSDAAGAGTLQLTPQSRVLLIRTLHRSPHGNPARLSISGSPMSPALQPAHGSVERALTHVAQMTLRAVRQFIRWSQLNASTPNIFTAPPTDMADEIQGDPDTHYSLARYELAEGEWLEVELPQVACDYWSLHAYNHWCEYLPRASVHDLSASTDARGRVRVRVGPSLSSTLINRIDTLGRRRGVLIFRTLGASGQRLPSAVLKSS
jgi:hypothetical protein